jgi:hypothetical protein
MSKIARTALMVAALGGGLSSSSVFALAVAPHWQIPDRSGHDLQTNPPWTVTTPCPQRRSWPCPER